MMKINSLKFFNWLLIGVLAVAFFVATSSFNYLTQDQNYVKWSSPDETANYFFSKRFSETGQLAIFDQAAVVGDNMVMPRSFRSDAGWLKPVSFLGIILTYGGLGKLFGIGIIPFLTPCFAALGIIIFYLLIRRIFRSERIALLSAFILAVFPVYIYYTVRSMFHNILFLVLLLLGAYLFTLALGNKKEKSEQRFFSFRLPERTWPEFLSALLSGIFIGGAIITRTSELIWLAPLLFLIWLFYARRFGFAKLIILGGGILLTLLPVAYWNTILYNSPFLGGYNEMNRSLIDISRRGGDIVKLTLSGQLNQYRQVLQGIAKNIFYFGFNREQSITMFRHYIPGMFPFLFWPAMFGGLLLVIQNIRNLKKKYLVYILGGLLISAILIFYYGSWKFNDNPDPTHFTIGNSYTRYWLPIYLFLMPLAALTIVKISRALLLMKESSRNRLKGIIAAGLQAVAVAVIAFSGFLFVLYGSEEGLAYLYYNVQAEKTNTEKVLSLTASDGVIITRYYDKFFFPERRIIMGTIPDDEVLTAAAKLVYQYPVYYYSFYLNEADVNYLNERKLAPYNLQLQFIKKINPKFGLYQLNYQLYEKK